MLLCFSFFLFAADSLSLLLLGAARAFARPVFKALEEKGENEWPLNCLFLFLRRRPKVQSKQPEVNGFIFSFSVAFCARLKAPPFFVLLAVIISIYSAALLKVTSICPNAFRIQKHSILVVVLEFDLFLCEFWKKRKGKTKQKIFKMFLSHIINVSSKPFV